MLKKYFNLLYGEIVKYICELKRYFFNTFSMLLASFIFFLGIFYSIKHFSGQNNNINNLSSLIIGYITWIFAQSAYFNLPSNVIDEIQKGTYEQLNLTSIGIMYVFFNKILINLIFDIIEISLVLILIMSITGIWLKFSIIKILVVLLISLPSLWGFGIFFSGMAILFKKISGFLSIINLVLITLVAFPAYPINFYSFLPYTMGATTMRMMIIKNQKFNLEWYVIIIVLSLLYFFSGIVGYNICEKLSRKKNLLGQY